VGDLDELIERALAVIAARQAMRTAHEAWSTAQRADRGARAIDTEVGRAWLQASRNATRLEQEFQEACNDAGLHHEHFLMAVKVGRGLQEAHPPGKLG
jgi:DNA-binding transcriptional regulator YbjK